MFVISVLNLKGGVAKTTTAVNMAYLLAKSGKRTLLIDNDKQGNASKAFNLYDPEAGHTAAELLTDCRPDMDKIIRKTGYGNLDIITSNMNLLSANMQALMDTCRLQQTRFKKALAAVRDAYDFCIIDNAPDINISIINALAVTNDVIIPLMIDDYSLDGLDILVEQLEQIKEDFNPSLRIAGCLVTNFERAEVDAQGEEFVRAGGLPVFKTHIRHTNGKVKESTFAKIPLDEYSPRCGAARDYREFLKEYLEGREQDGI